MNLKNFPDELFNKLAKFPKSEKSISIGDSIHFYGQQRGVFFEVLNAAASSVMKDIRVKKFGLQDLMDAKYAKDGIH
ncbi:MAG: hypothetical protein CM1200mP1_06630 [Candidatus Neomarinimicrobiota bacterium]|nr:MAG: hypothetical protein CM1200mP1_06630 [Candidatus Neomarinimicrobiota bacterium]